MNTSNEAVRLLNQAYKTALEANNVISNLIAAHDYQDVAALVSQAACDLIEAAVELMQSQDETAMDKIEAAEDLLDAVYGIIDGELDEE